MFFTIIPPKATKTFEHRLYTHRFHGHPERCKFIPEEADLAPRHVTEGQSVLVVLLVPCMVCLSELNGSRVFDKQPVHPRTFFTENLLDATAVDHIATHSVSHRHTHA